ncbi:glycosyltransferase [Paenibacillus sp. F411]|uniref:glycosyltransferase n=1 Tax=Paenibacillus sp. F411 TaxID=2820239 RepID=UPI0032676CD8
METPVISLCMIVRNEADCIGRCLSSVSPYVDEMIIVDTGSTDDTPAICKEYGAKVLDYTWNEHFAEARNFGLHQARGQWILWLDADEELGEGGELLKQLATEAEYDLFSFELNNYYGTEVDDHRIIQISHPRMFRNGLGFQFRNKIHEALNVEEVFGSGSQMLERMGNAPVTLWHYGYLESQVQVKDKAKRNLQLLQQALSDNPEDPWLHYHMASECYRLKKLNESFQHTNRSIVAFLSNRLTPPSLLYKLKYSILISVGSYDGAYPAIEKAIMLYPDYVDLVFYKGVVLMQLKKFEAALEAFEQCLEIGDSNLAHLTQKGLGSFQAWHYKGMCQELLKNNPEAKKCYEQALMIYPQHAESIEALNKLKLKSK